MALPKNPLPAKPWLRPGALLYREVRRSIADAINALEWRPGEVIPSEKKLCERFGVSMGTLRKAVDELTASGVLVRKQGLGTFVARHSLDRYLFSFFHLVGHDGDKAYPGVRFLRFETVTADAFAVEALAVPASTRLLHLCNVLSLKGQPVSIDHIYLPAARFAGLTERRLREREATLYQLYQDEFDISVVRTSERVRGFAATSEQAELLGVAVGAPLLLVIRVAYTLRDRAVELRYSYVDTRRCEYRPDPFVREQD